MTVPDGQIATSNFTSVKRAYLTDVLLPACAHVEDRLAPTERSYRLAGRLIRVRYFGPALLDRLGRALAHRETASDDAPDLTIMAWDSAGSGVAFASPWSHPSYRFDVETNARQEADGFKGAYLCGEETLSLSDPQSKHAYFWTLDATRLPPWVSAAPFRTLLHWALADLNTQLVHGAVVAAGGGSVLLAAKGGSGKSTTALSCALAGMEYLGDDYVAVSLGPVVVAHGLYASAKVSPERVPAFRALASRVWDREGEKSIVFLSDAIPGQLRADAPLSAVLIPTVAHLDRTEIVPARKGDALLALAPTTLMQLPLARTDAAARLGEIVARTPCFALRLGRDSGEAAEAIRDFLARV